MRRTDRWLLGSLVLLIAWLSAVEIERARRGPVAESDWRDAARHVLQEGATNDTVLLNSGGDTSGLQALRGAGLRPLLSLPEPRGRVRNLWLVGSRDDPPAGLDGFTAGGPATYGGVTVIPYTRSVRDGVLWRAADNLSQAQVTLDGRPCRTPHKGGWRCAGAPDWMHVSPETHLVGGAQRTCLWAHPAADDKPLTLTWSAVPAGQLTLSHGLTDHAARSGNRSPVRIRVRSGGKEQVFESTNGSGWTPHLLKVDGDLTITVRASKDGQRHHCLSAAIR
jgi:hypothetical protein